MGTMAAIQAVLAARLVAPHGPGRHLQLALVEPRLRHARTARPACRTSRPGCWQSPADAPAKSACRRSCVMSSRNAGGSLSAQPTHAGQKRAREPPPDRRPTQISCRMPSRRHHRIRTFDLYPLNAAAGTLISPISLTSSGCSVTVKRPLFVQLRAPSLPASSRPARRLARPRSRARPETRAARRPAGWRFQTCRRRR